MLQPGPGPSCHNILHSLISSSPTILAIFQNSSGTCNCKAEEFLQYIDADYRKGIFFTVILTECNLKMYKEGNILSTTC